MILIGVSLLCGALNALGGYHWLWMRRYLMPVVIGATVSLITQIWWLGVVCLPVIGTLCLGYFKWGNLGRALWIGLQCLVLGLGLCLTGHLSYLLFVPYVVGGCVLGGLYKNWYQPVGDFVTGFYMSLIIPCLR